MRILINQFFIRQNEYSVGFSSANNVLLQGARFSSAKRPVRDAFDADLFFDKFVEHVENRAPAVTTNRLIIACFLMTYTGLRINEVRQLQYGQLRLLLKNGHVTVKNVKRISKRVIALSSKHRTLLSYLLTNYNLYPNNAEPSDSFFIVYGRNSYLKPISRQYFNELVDFLLKEFADSLELDEKPFWTSHSFRIGYITRLIKKKKISLHEVQRFVGHKNIQTTTLYSRYLITGKDQVELLNRLEESEEPDEEIL